MPKSRILPAMISSTRSSPPFTFSASFRMPSSRFCSAASSASISLFSFLRLGNSFTSVSAVERICSSGLGLTVSVIPGKYRAFLSSSCPIENVGKNACSSFLDGVHAAAISDSSAVASSRSSR